MARGSAGKDRTERNPLDILPAPSASSGDQLHAAPDAEHRALAPGHGVLFVATVAAWEGSVHDLPALRAMRNGRVGTSMIHVVTRGRLIPECGHSGVPRTDGIVLPESPASSTARLLSEPAPSTRGVGTVPCTVRCGAQNGLIATLSRSGWPCNGCLKERSYSPGTPRNLTR